MDKNIDELFYDDTDEIFYCDDFDQKTFNPEQTILTILNDMSLYLHRFERTYDGFITIEFKISSYYYTNDVVKVVFDLNDLFAQDNFVSYVEKMIKKSLKDYISQIKDFTILAETLL